MTNNPFYSGDGPMPFQDVFEEEPEGPGKKKRPRMIFPGGMMGSMGGMGAMGYMDGPMLPFLMGPAQDYEEEEDPNP